MFNTRLALEAQDRIDKMRADGYSDEYISATYLSHSHRISADDLNVLLTAPDRLGGYVEVRKGVFETILTRDLVVSTKRFVGRYSHSAYETRSRSPVGFVIADMWAGQPSRYFLHTSVRV